MNDKYVLKLLEDRLYASDAMINGWIITGFPKNIAQINFLKSNQNFLPSLVVQLGLDDEYVQKKSSSRRIDTSTGNKNFLYCKIRQSVFHRCKRLQQGFIVKASSEKRR